MVRLTPITTDNYQTCLHLTVSEKQKNFVCSNADSLAKCLDDVLTTPLAIYSDETMIGLIVIKYNEAYQNYFLWEFMIDAHFQAQGLGRLALLLLIQHLKQQTTALNLVTTYKYHNDCAKHLYESVGFTFLSDCPEQSETDLILQLN